MCRAAGDRRQRPAVCLMGRYTHTLTQRHVSHTHTDTHAQTTHTHMQSCRHTGKRLADTQRPTGPARTEKPHTKTQLHTKDTRRPRNHTHVETQERHTQTQCRSDSYTDTYTHTDASPTPRRPASPPSTQSGGKGGKSQGRLISRPPPLRRREKPSPEVLSQQRVTNEPRGGGLREST